MWLTHKTHKNNKLDSLLRRRKVRNTKSVCEKRRRRTKLDNSANAHQRRFSDYLKIIFRYQKNKFAIKTTWKKNCFCERILSHHHSFHLSVFFSFVWNVTARAGNQKVQWPPKHTQNVRARVCRKKITKWLFSEVSYTKWAEKAASESRRKDAQSRIDDNEEFLRLAFLVFRLDKAKAGIALKVDAGCRMILGGWLFCDFFGTWCCGWFGTFFNAFCIFRFSILSWFLFLLVLFEKQSFGHLTNNLKRRLATFHELKTVKNRMHINYIQDSRNVWLVLLLCHFLSHFVFSYYFRHCQTHHRLADVQKSIKRN